MSDDYSELRLLGRTGLMVSSVSLGASPLGGVPKLYGYDTSADSARETLLRAFRGPFTLLDTSNNYSNGESERRIGEAIRANGGLPEGFMVVTKVDRDPDTDDFSGARVRRSIEESVERLGIDSFPIVHLHDPEFASFEQITGRGGALEVLVRLKDEGVAKNLGVAAGSIEVSHRYLDTGIFDVVLTHNRYSLLDRFAGPLLDQATKLGLGVFNAAPYGGGMLSKGAKVQPVYGYGMGGESLRERAIAMEAACSEFGVPLAAAALQFSVRDPRIHSTIVGVSAAHRIDETSALLMVPIEDALWERLDALAPPPDEWINE